MKCEKFLENYCLSCDLLNMDYLASVSFKEQKLLTFFSKSSARIKPSVVCTDGAQGTRNKAKLAVAKVGEQVQFGFYDKNYLFKQLEDCPLQSDPINSTLPIIKKLILNYTITPYDIENKKGELKYLLITYSLSTHELLIRFILRSKESLERLRKLADELILINPLIKVVTANIQNIHQAVLEGEEEIILTKKTYISHQFDDYILYQGARSFFQTNTKVAKALYLNFQDELKGKNILNLLDLYCGVGAFSFYASKFCDNVIGVEISKEAIHFANLAKEINKNSNIRFIFQDAEEYLNQKGQIHFDAIVVNPPRRGLNNQIINQLMKLSAKNIFYSSCNVETLFRDLEELENKYQVESLQIFDMFPFTSHFEVFAVLLLK